MKWMSENMKTQRVEVKGSKKTSFGIGVWNEWKIVAHPPSKLNGRASGLVGSYGPAKETRAHHWLQKYIYLYKRICPWVYHEFTVLDILWLEFASSASRKICWKYFYKTLWLYVKKKCKVNLKLAVTLGNNHDKISERKKFV